MRNWAVIIAIYMAIAMLLPVVLVGKVWLNVYHYWRRSHLPVCDHFWVYMGMTVLPDDHREADAWKRWRCEHCGEERLS